MQLNKTTGTFLFQNRLLFPILLALVLLSGCGKHNDNNATQTVATVDGTEITIHQVNEELARLNIQPSQKEAANKQIVKALVEKQLLVNAAIKDKLDRNPAVLQAIERAKSQILAQAYIESRLSSIAKPGQSEIESYFNKHPELFVQRQLVSMTQLNLSTLDLSADLKKDLDSAKTLNEVSQKLDGRGIRYQKNSVTRVLGELAPNVSDKIKSMIAGQFLVVNAGPQTSIISVDGIKESPVKIEEASSMISNYLLSNKRKEAGESLIEQLRGSAKITYSDSSQNNLDAKPAPATNSSNGANQDAASKSNDLKDGVKGL